MSAKAMAELVNVSTGERLIRPVVSQGANAVYVSLGLFGATKPAGFFLRTKKPIPSNPYKNLRLSICFHE